jgi:type II secretory pathway pseudopilin PulG
MNLAGQARNDRGYAMAALLIVMSIAALMMTAVMPVWKQMAQREKEEELVFRGLQYVHAITLYGRKFANTQPPNLDVLIQQKYLRKKYKDPVTNDDFQLVLANQAAAGAGGAAQPGAQRGGSAPGLGSGTAATPGSATPGQTPGGTGRGISQIGTPGAGPVGGIVGVASKSKAKSIRLYNGRSHYNEWVFMYQPQQAPGAGAGAPGVPGQRGQPGAPQNPFGGQGPLGGQRGRGGNPGGGRQGGPGGSGGPGFPNGPPGAPPFGTRGR